MRIVFFTLNAYDMLAGTYQRGAIGGAQVQQILVGRELVARGHDVYFVEYANDIDSRGEIDGIKIIEKSRPSGSELTRGWQIIRDSYRILEDINPDICYRRSLDFEIQALAMLCKLKDIRFVYGIAHDNNLDLVPSTFTYGVKSTKIYGRLNRVFLSMTDAVIAQNDYQYSKSNEVLNTDVYKITNCYMRSNSKPIREITDIANLVVLWVARFVSFKRPNLMLDIASELPNIHFVMIGTRGDEVLYQQTRSRASCLDNVTFVGFVPFSEIDRYFISADVFLNTSSEEGFPNTFLQSWAYQKPVISLKVDPDNILTNKEVGWVLNDSVEEAINLLSELSTDMDKLSKIGQNAREYFEEHHSIKSVVDNYEKVFKDIISQKN